MERKGKAGEKRKTVLSPETESLLEEFLLYFGTRRNASPASQMAYGTDLRNFASFMKRRGTDLGSPERVTARDVQAWVAWLYRKGEAKSSMARRLSAARTFFRWLKRRSLIRRNLIA